MGQIAKALMRAGHLQPVADAFGSYLKKKQEEEDRKAFAGNIENFPNSVKGIYSNSLPDAQAQSNPANFDYTENMFADKDNIPVGNPGQNQAFKVGKAQGQDPMLVQQQMADALYKAQSGMAGLTSIPQEERTRAYGAMQSLTNAYTPQVKKPKTPEYKSFDPMDEIWDVTSGTKVRAAKEKPVKEETPESILLSSEPSKYGVTKKYGYKDKDGKTVITKQDFERTNYDPQDGNGKDKKEKKLPSLNEKDSDEINNFMNPQKKKYDQSGYSYGPLPKEEVERGRSEAYKYLKLKLLGERPETLTWLKKYERDSMSGGFRSPEDLRKKAAEDFKYGLMNQEDADYLNNYLKYYNQYYQPK